MSRHPSPISNNVAGSSALRRTHTLAVLGVALAARLLVIWIVVTRYSPQWLFSRGMEMGLLAKSLLAGEGLGSPFGPRTGPTAFVAPVYPLLVAAVFKVFGSFSLTSELVILSAQAALNLVTIWLIMHITRQLFNQTTATVAGMIWACSLPLIWLPTIFWETSLSCCLVTGFIALLCRYTRQTRIDPVQWSKLGGCCGFAALVNPALLPSLAGMVVWTAWRARKQSVTNPLLAALSFALVFAPWPIRNARCFHAFIPLRTTVGFELWMGNHPGSTGFLEESLFPTFNTQELADYNSRGEVNYTRHKSDLAWKYIGSNPGIFMSLTLKRVFRFWAGTGTQHGSIFFVMHGVFTSIFGIAGLFLLLRARGRIPFGTFVIPLILFPLPYAITHAEFRYRIVIDPLLTIFASYAVVELCRLLLRVNSRAPAQIKGPSAPCVPVSLASTRIAWRQP